MSSIASFLLDWYDKQGRDLPWRADKNPYRVWLSEIMLQQTRIEQAKGYFERFVTAFPDVKTLAEANEEDVLKMWEGLGYYSRARNLLKGARMIACDLDGTFPRTKQALKEIPGIGEYTSSAIASICFDQKEIALDGNLFRVYCRLNAAKESFESQEAKKKATEYFRSQLPLRRAGDFNQALMDVGETICLPNGEPDCLRCPLASFCSANKDGNPTKYPLPKIKKEKTRVSLFVFLISWNGLYAIKKRKPSGLLASLYEFPNCRKEESVSKALEGMGNPGVANLIGSSTHVFSHVVWNMDWYWVSCDSKPNRPDLIFVCERDLREKIAIPNAFSNFLKRRKLLGF